jgi:restriction system protein
VEEGVNDDHQLPSQGVFLHAVLRHLADHPEGDRRNNVHEAMPKLVGLTESQRMERLASGKPRYRSRSGWGLSMLKAAGYVDSPALGVWRITSRGRELLAAYPNGFDEERARQVIRESRMGSQGAAPQEDARGEPETPLLPQPPDERIDDAASEIEQAVARDLLERILQAPPAFFEQLVIDLLHALGYGTGAGDSTRLGGSGDGGVDGVIALDRLGLEKVYLQAKRWQGSVGRPDVQAFFGALAGRHARKGVFITTSTFTREAKEYGDQMGENVVLIDGARLTRLMIENSVAVTHYRVVRLPRVDQDYFETT